MSGGAYPAVLGITINGVNVNTVTLFFALLAGLAALTTLIVGLSAVAGDRFGAIATIRPVAVEFAAAVALTATFGSLYLSEIVGYEPCRLCWVQRVFMYPAALLLVAALVLRRRNSGDGDWSSLTGPARRLVAAAGVWALIGLPVAAFHRYEQAVGGVGDFCDQDNPCSLRWVEEFGFVTIPVMAGVGFVTIATMAAVALKSGAPDQTQAPRNVGDSLAPLEHH